MRDLHRPPTELTTTELADQLLAEQRAEMLAYARANHPSAGTPAWDLYTAAANDRRATWIEVVRRLYFPEAMVDDDDTTWREKARELLRQTRPGPAEKARADLLASRATPPLFSEDRL